MVQNDPNNMQAPTERTVVKILYDDRSVYVGVINYMRDPSKDHDRARAARYVPAQRLDQDHVRSPARSPDGVHLRFESLRRAGRHDLVRRHAIEHGLRRRLGCAHGDHPRRLDRRIPHSVFAAALLLTPGEAVVWGFNIRRDIVYNAEMIRWVATPRGSQGFVSRFGHITFAKPPRRRAGSSCSRSCWRGKSTSPPPDTGDDLSGGLDFRMGLGTATTLSAAINPDFGQVEQDPAVLQPERVRDLLSGEAAVLHRGQPFARADVHAQATMFHSRRIGQRPDRYALAEGETLIERPDADHDSRGHEGHREG